MPVNPVTERRLAAQVWAGLSVEERTAILVARQATEGHAVSLKALADYGRDLLAWLDGKAYYHTPNERT